jgi:hypothetical protein
MCLGSVSSFVKAIILSIDQWEQTFGNREFFPDKPYGIGCSRNGDVP